MKPSANQESENRVEFKHILGDIQPRIIRVVQTVKTIALIFDHNIKQDFDLAQISDDRNFLSDIL